MADSTGNDVFGDLRREISGTDIGSIWRQAQDLCDSLEDRFGDRPDLPAFIVEHEDDELYIEWNIGTLTAGFSYGVHRSMSGWFISGRIGDSKVGFMRYFDDDDEESAAVTLDRYLELSKDMYGTEKMRAEILAAYLDGADRDPKHDGYVIQELKNLGYLHSGMDMDTEEETLSTTEFGKRYLKTLRSICKP